MLSPARGMFKLYPGPNKTFYVTVESLRVINALRTRFEIVREWLPEDIPIRIVVPVKALLHELPPPETRAEVAALAMSRKDRSKPSCPVYLGRIEQHVADSFVMDAYPASRSYRWRWTTDHTNTGLPSIGTSFSRIIARLRDPETRFVLSLGSGGLRMFAHASIFKLIEILAGRGAIDEIWGCSGGAIMGMGYSLGAEPDALEQFGFDIYQNRQSIRINPSKMDILKNLILDTLFPGTTIALRGYVDVREIMNNGFEQVARLRRPDIPLFAVTYNMNKKRTEVLTPFEINSRLYEGYIKRCSVINSVLASSAIPILHVPRIIKRGRTALTYIDGSFVEEIPLTSIYHKWRIDRKTNHTPHKKLFVMGVNLFPPMPRLTGLRRLPAKPFKFMQLLNITTQLIDLARRGRIAEQMQFLNAAPDIEAVEVHLPRISRRNCLDPEIIPPVIKRARAVFIDQILDIERSLPDDKRA